MCLKSSEVLLVCPRFMRVFNYTHCVCPVPHIADFSDVNFGCDRETPGLNPMDWQRGYIGLPSQRKTSNSDASVKNRPQPGMEAEGAHSSVCDAETSGAPALKG